MKNKVLFTSFIALLYMASCTQKKEEKVAVIKFTVTNPMVIDTSFTKQYVAQIRSIRNIEVRPQEKGFLQNIYVDEGQFVSSGQLLFRIMPKMYEAELLKSKAETKGAEIELLNAKTLVNKNIVSKSEQSLAEAKLEKARAEVAMAKLHLSFTSIRAPFSGTIDRIPKKLGSLVEEGELLTTLSDNSKIFAYFNVSEPEYLAYKNNTKDRANSTVDLLLANGEPHKYKGKIEVIEGEFDPETGNIAFRAIFPNNDKLLKNGETGKVLMTIPVKSALIIPQKATYEIQDRKYVFVIDKNNVAKSVEITVAGELPDLYIVSSGLNPNDKILLEGVQKVKDDEKIKYNYQKPKFVLNHLKLYTE